MAGDIVVVLESLRSPAAQRVAQALATTTLDVREGDSCEPLPPGVVGVGVHGPDARRIMHRIEHGGIAQVSAVIAAIECRPPAPPAAADRHAMTLHHQIGAGGRAFA